MWHIIFSTAWLKGFKGAKKFMSESISTRPQSPESNRSGKNSHLDLHPSLRWSATFPLGLFQSWCLTVRHDARDWHSITHSGTQLQTQTTILIKLLRQTIHVNSIHGHSFTERRVCLWHDRLPIFKYICRTLESTNGSYKSFISIQLLGWFGRNQNSVRRPAWLWHTASWASS
jgi:hypothetical protein